MKKIITYVVGKKIVTENMSSSIRAFYGELKSCEKFIEKEKKRLEGHIGCTFVFTIEKLTPGGKSEKTI